MTENKKIAKLKNQLFNAAKNRNWHLELATDIVVPDKYINQFKTGWQGDYRYEVDIYLSLNKIKVVLWKIVYLNNGDKEIKLAMAKFRRDNNFFKIDNIFDYIEMLQEFYE